MSPEISILGLGGALRKVVANVPDETGMHQMTDGKPLYVNIDRISGYNNRQVVIVQAEEFGGRRKIGLTQEGIGRSSDRKRGDGKTPEIEVKLLDRPIRVSYTDRIWHEQRCLAYPHGGYYREYKRTYVNPRWMKGHGQR